MRKLAYLALIVTKKFFLSHYDASYCERESGIDFHVSELYTPPTSCYLISHKETLCFGLKLFTLSSWSPGSLAFSTYHVFLSTTPWPRTIKALNALKSWSANSILALPHQARYSPCCLAAG